jgi:hypothetical protein
MAKYLEKPPVLYRYCLECGVDMEKLGFFCSLACRDKNYGNLEPQNG